MSSNSRWYLDTQHSFGFKADTKFRALHYNIKLKINKNLILTNMTINNIFVVVSKCNVQSHPRAYPQHSHDPQCKHSVFVSEYFAKTAWKYLVEFVLYSTTSICIALGSMSLNTTIFHFVSEYFGNNVIYFNSLDRDWLSVLLPQLNNL